MGYKIFFVYQSDTEDKFNKGFIHQASLDAIKRLKTEGFDVEFDYGFKNTPGTPILIDEMLKKNDEADMVLVDLTFTSSKTWFFAKKCSRSGKYFAYTSEKEEKLSSNPNVLLETGYAWANKGTYRTLAIMNTAYGHPNELSVDLNGFRWGITYQLDETNYEERKSIRKELIENLYKAFKDVLNSEASHQIKKWSPFRIGSQLEKDHVFPYKLTASFKEKLIDIREKLINYKGAIRITGVSGTGKSRLVFEVFRDNDGLEYDNNFEKILYYDLLGTGYGDISKQIADLISLDQQKIVVIDNCDFLLHEKISKDFKNTNIKLITINSVDSSIDTDSANIFIEEDISLEVNELLLKERFGEEHLDLLIDKVGSDLNKTIPILESNLDSKETGKDIFEFLEIIIGTSEKEKKALQFLTVISLFNYAGVTGHNTLELTNIKEIFFLEWKEEEIEQSIKILQEKRLIIRKGDFIIPSAFKEELVSYWWINDSKNINQLVKGIKEKDLLNRFIDQLINIIDSKTISKIMRELNSEDGVLQNNDFIDSSLGSQLLYKLATKEPEIVIDIVSQKIDRL